MLLLVVSAHRPVEGKMQLCIPLNTRRLPFSSPLLFGLRGMGHVVAALLKKYMNQLWEYKIENMILAAIDSHFAALPSSPRVRGVILRRFFCCIRAEWLFFLLPIFLCFMNLRIFPDDYALHGVLNRWWPNMNRTNNVKTTQEYQSNRKQKLSYSW